MMSQVDSRWPAPRRVELLVRALRAVLLTAVALTPALLTGAVRGRRGGADQLHRRLVGLLPRLGPAFVKVGQLLATRRDVLSPRLCARLAVLHDRVPPMPDAVARRALRASYGSTLDDLGIVVRMPAVGSGSVACVYRADLPDGGALALKLRRPGVVRAMALDLALLRAGAAVLARLPALRGVPVREVVGQVCDAVHGQLDFRAEAASLRALRANLAELPGVRVPEVRADLCRDDCVVMEHLPDLRPETARRWSPDRRRLLAERTLRAIYHMLFVDGFVHCDLHPGNLCCTEDGEVVVLDAGFSVRLPEPLRRSFAEFFLHLSAGRGEECARIALATAVGVRPDADLARFRAGIADLAVRNSRLPAERFSLVAFGTEMFDLHRVHGVRAAPELVFPLLSLLMIEGAIRELDPAVDFQRRARPILVKSVLT